MKKYLMFAFAALAFVGCSKSTDVSDANRTPQGDKYANAFAETFGNINPNVNWGFTPMTVYSATTTRAHNVNRNEWGTGSGFGGSVAVPKNVNDPTVNENEQTLVYNYFNKKREGAVNQNNVNWSDYFITEVWKGTHVDKDGNGKDVLGSDHMNHLQVRYGEGSIDANGNLVGAWEHANDFNGANQNTSFESAFGKIEGHTFMYSSGTLDFAYHNSIDSKYHNEYIIIPGAEIDPTLADYYYIGFDFYATHPTGQDANKNMDVARDWYFTDWIVRISPAEFINAQRVMVEDLIATSLTNVDKSDWDFNDAVFDVIFTNEWVASASANKLVAHIKLNAAGGTMALTIGGKEVHSLFGVSTSTMVNTNAAGVGAAADGKLPVTFTVIIGDADYSGTLHTADEVPVFIGSTELKAETGKAPQKIVTSTSTRWMKEKKLITTGYAKFADYVNSNSPQNWYNEVTGPDNLY